jgi:predicted O-methyltransferase YrrM
MQEHWTAVERHFQNLFAPSDAALNAALQASAAAELPPQHVSPLQGKLLMILARAIGARQILEIGTLGGYSTIWLARALPPEGRIVSLEVVPRHAEVARENVERAGLSGQVEIRVGPALASLPRIAAENRGPFDLVFIDADKASNPRYLDWSLQLTRPGSLIIADNVVRGGGLIDAASTDPNILGISEFNERLAKDPRLVATALQTVGGKGWDGFAIAIVAAG